MQKFNPLFRIGLALVLGLTGLGAATASPAYPAHPIQIVVPAAPGGSPDILARIIAPILSEKLGQPVYIDNRPGGAGNIASERVARAAPDGYTLLLATDIISINETLFDHLPFDARTSFSPVIDLISSPQVFAVNPAVAAHTVQEFLQQAKERPNRYSLASPAIGTTGQLGVLLLQAKAGITVTPVVYRSAQPAITDVLGGHADGVIVTIAPALPLIRSGQLRALAVSTEQRSASLPDVPTFLEAGVPDYAFDSWQGIVVPAGTPDAVIQTLNRAFNETLADPKIRGQLTEQAFDPVGGDPAHLRDVILHGIDAWGEIVRANHIHLQ